MADKPIAEGQYDKTQTAQRNADVDVALSGKPMTKPVPRRHTSSFPKRLILKSSWPAAPNLKKSLHTIKP